MIILKDNMRCRLGLCVCVWGGGGGGGGGERPDMTAKVREKSIPC